MTAGGGTGAIADAQFVRALIELDRRRRARGEGIDQRVQRFGALAGDALETAHRLAARVADDAALARKLLEIDRLQARAKTGSSAPRCSREKIVVLIVVDADDAKAARRP